jgi:hypothetical protein
MHVDLKDSPSWAAHALYTADSPLWLKVPEQMLPLSATQWTGGFADFGWEIRGIAVSPSSTHPGVFERLGYIYLHTDCRFSKDSSEGLPDELYAAFVEPSRQKSFILA